LLSEVNRLTFEHAIAGEDDECARKALEADKAKLLELHSELAPLQNEINQLTRQFWVSRDQAKSKNYDLTASRYRDLELDEGFFDTPDVTMNRLDILAKTIAGSMRDVKALIK
jgi:type I restriction enzyme M protein